MLISVGDTGSTYVIFCAFGVGICNSRSNKLSSLSCSIPSTKTFLPMLLPSSTVSKLTSSEIF